MGWSARLWTNIIFIPSCAGTPSAYLEEHIFPVLLQGIEETLQVAKRTEVNYTDTCRVEIKYLSAVSDLEGIYIIYGNL